ncbi:ComEC/Rec2 family competence protein [Tenacibaculum piscium]|uniref:ComEC/Rec2 family competence protein n=1 Tax=Tenacibaculum piscium TaxID=1458515 RepID=UPI001F2CD253|nr:ComEC/Rec2 family competence protein [Tenacibaculum piscium]
MKKLKNYLPFHFLICVIIGILTQYYTHIWHYNFIYLAILMLLITGVLLLFKNKIASKIYYTITTFLFFILLGISTTFLDNPRNLKNYYQEHLRENSENSGAILQIHKVLKSGNYADKYIAKVIQIDTKKTTGSILVNINKDSISTPLQVDERLFIASEFQNINIALNPHQFDYADYLAKKHVYQQVFLNQNNYKKVPTARVSIYGLSADFRRKIQTSLKKYDFTKNELSVINALLLGQRKNISKSLIESYTDAGAIHILAISGLHIGIILMMLNYFLSPIEHLKNGLLFKTILLVILLWMFAFIAGLSASVVRAVTMFTFVAIGDSFKRKKVVEFSLISSMLFLLLIQPLFLFDIGFQLSYLAVFGIIWVQPLLFNLWNPKGWFLSKFWSLLSVSITAQVGILPLILYYFHQFPGLFFVSNLLIIPFLGAILMGGILTITFALLHILPAFFVDFYGFIISLMNEIVTWVAQQKQFLWQEIPMSFIQMLVWYCLIIFTYQLIISKKMKSLILVLIAMISLQIVFIFDEKKQQETREFIVFHKGKSTLLGIRNGDKLQVFHNTNHNKNQKNIKTKKNINTQGLEISEEKNIKAYQINEGVTSNFPSKIPAIFSFYSDTILLVDSLGIYDISLKKPIVILQNSPKINLTRLLKKLNPKQIIADGSNYKSYVNRWEATCGQQKTPFHSTRKNGAFYIKKE